MIAVTQTNLKDHRVSGAEVTRRHREKRDITDIASPFNKVVAMKSTAASTPVCHRFEKLFTGTALTFALMVVQGFVNPAAHSSEVPATASVVKRSETPSTTHPAKHQPLRNGTYLYGQSSNPDQIGAAYLVFEVDQDQVVGAFYMPQSSFDCFHGNLKANELALTIVNSYEKTSYPYEVALKTEATSASAVSPGVPMGLEGYQAIDRLSANDQRILSTCKANFGVHS